MKLRMEKSSWGDLIILGLIGVLVCGLVLQIGGMLSPSSRGGGTLGLFVAILVLGVLAGVPAFMRLQTSAPLVEMDDENVTFFVGRDRNERCRIPRSALLLVSVQRHRDEPILSLLFDGDAVRPLRQFTWTPYLEIKGQEVLIEPAHVKGNAELVADTWNRAIEARNSQKLEDRGQTTEVRRQISDVSSQ